MDLLGKAHDKAFWTEVREKDSFKRYRDELLDTWEKHNKDYHPECLKYSEFKLFWTTGDRDKYQAPYFHRRTMAENAALLALIYPDEPKYLDRLMDILYAILDEYTWCLPAHQGELEPNNNSRIDLFAAETGYMLAEMDVLLRDRLDGLIHNRIMAETERRIIKPFSATEDYGWWEKGVTNWTSVCMGSVACTYMLLYPELVDDKLIDRANRSMETFLTGMGDDGVCFEGCGYWGYGFGFFVMYADMIRTFTEGKVDFFKREKVKQISMFPQRMFLSGDAGVSFSDGAKTVKYTVGLTHYLKNEYPDDILVYSPKYSGNGLGKFATHLRSASWAVEEYGNNIADDSVSTEFFAWKAGWFTKRTPNYGFAAKAGSNAEPHNHNDVGSFIFAKNGRQIFVDLGSGHYTRQYFAHDTRYTILECSSRGHSVPMIGDTCQYMGVNSRSSDVKYENGIFSMNIAGTYVCDGLSRIDRSFSFTDESVTLTDEFTYTGSSVITDRIVTLIKPEIISENEIAAEEARIKFDPEQCTAIINSEVSEKGTTVYFIDFKLNPGVKTFSCTMR